LLRGGQRKHESPLMVVHRYLAPSCPASALIDGAALGNVSADPAPPVTATAIAAQTAATAVRVVVPARIASPC